MRSASTIAPRPSPSGSSSPPPTATRPNSNLTAAADRLWFAAKLYKAGKVKYFIVSGTREGRYDEPTAMRAGLIERGVPAEAIFTLSSSPLSATILRKTASAVGERQILPMQTKVTLKTARSSGSVSRAAT